MAMIDYFYAVKNKVGIPVLAEGRHYQSKDLGCSGAEFDISEEGVLSYRPNPDKTFFPDEDNEGAMDIKHSCFSSDTLNLYGVDPEGKSWDLDLVVVGNRIVKVSQYGDVIYDADGEPDMSILNDPSHFITVPKFWPGDKGVIAYRNNKGELITGGPVVVLPKDAGLLLEKVPEIPMPDDLVKQITETMPSFTGAKSFNVDFEGDDLAPTISRYLDEIITRFPSKWAAKLQNAFYGQVVYNRDWMAIRPWDRYSPTVQKVVVKTKRDYLKMAMDRISTEMTDELSGRRGSFVWADAFIPRRAKGYEKGDSVLDIGALGYLALHDTAAKVDIHQPLMTDEEWNNKVNEILFPSPKPE